MSKIKQRLSRQELLRRRVLRPKFEWAYKKQNKGKEINFLMFSKSCKYMDPEVNSAWITYLSNN